MPVRTYTTYQIAKVCDVYPSSVIGWINAGKLKAYETPGGHHRVTPADLLAFLNQFNIPVPDDIKEAASAGVKRILIVDDDRAFTAMLARAYEPYASSLKVDVCHDGVEALIRIGEWQPQLVVLDLLMPRMGGFDVCYVVKKKLAAHAGGVKIVVVSGKLMPADEQLKAHGIDGFFEKPVDIPRLMAKSAELLAVAPAPAAG